MAVMISSYLTRPLRTLEQALEDRAAAVDAVFGGWAETDDSEIWGALARLTPGFDRESATNY